MNIELEREEYWHWYHSLTGISQKEKEELLEEIMALKQEIRNLKISIEIAKSSDEDGVVSSNTNLDVMKRLAQLEQIVYGKEE